MDVETNSEVWRRPDADALVRSRSHVLIVDDHPGSRALCAGYVDLFDHTSEAVRDGALAVEALRRGPFGVVVMNVHMDASPALETLGAIRALPYPASETPVIGLTAVGRGDEAQRWLAAGMAAVLAKPITAARLFEALGAALDNLGDAARSWAPAI
jgi:CheY-like chemotaxis protein